MRLRSPVQVIMCRWVHIFIRTQMSNYDVFVKTNNDVNASRTTWKRGHKRLIIIWEVFQL